MKKIVQHLAHMQSENHLLDWGCVLCRLYQIPAHFIFLLLSYPFSAAVLRWSRRQTDCPGALHWAERKPLSYGARSSHGTNCGPSCHLLHNRDKKAHYTCKY